MFCSRWGWGLPEIKLRGSGIYIRRLGGQLSLNPRQGVKANLKTASYIFSCPKNQLPNWTMPLPEIESGWYWSYRLRGGPLNLYPGKQSQIKSRLWRWFLCATQAVDSPYSETSNTPKLFIYCTRAPCTAAGNSLKNTQKHRILNQNINIWNVEQRIITFTLLIVQFPKNNLVHIWCGGKRFRSMKYEMVNICPLKFVVRQAAFFLSPTPLLWLWLPLTTSSFLTSLPFAILAALYCSYR